MGPRPKPTEPPSTARPHPDDDADVRAGLEEAERGDVLTAEESAAYLRSLLEDEQSDR